MAANLLRNDSSFVQMVILTADHRNPPLTWEEASEIEKYIFNEVCAIDGKRPCFKGHYVFSREDGAMIINTHVNSVNWLKNVIGSYQKKALRITDIKNSPQYTAKVRATVPRLNSKVMDNLFNLLETHNYGLQTKGWRISSIIKNITYMGRSLILLIDDPGRKMLERNDFKLSLGFSTVTFELLGRRKRSETTGEICVDNIQSQDD